MNIEVYQGAFYCHRETKEMIQVLAIGTQEECVPETETVVVYKWLKHGNVSVEPIRRFVSVDDEGNLRFEKVKDKGAVMGLGYNFGDHLYISHRSCAPYYDKKMFQLEQENRGVLLLTEEQTRDMVRNLQNFVLDWGKPIKEVKKKREKGSWLHEFFGFRS